jgi:argininosuccinate lyase
VIEALTRAVRRLLQALDDRATRRLRHKLTEFVEYASRTAAQELFAGLAIDRLSAETGLPFVQAHRAVSALMQSLPEAKRSDSERARDLKHEMMELPWAAAVREVLEALGRSPTLKRIGNRILRSWSRA